MIGILWDELDKNHWREVVVTGPVQSSKSFGALVIPTLRDIVELKYSPILGVPEADMFADKWDRDFKPVLEASEDLRWLLPSVGSGQRGGRVRDRVTFGNGTDLKVLSRGGQSTNKAGYTTPRLRITEAAGFSEASGSERDEEADSFRQMVGRLGAFDLMDPRRLVMIEGTVTVEDQLPWKMRGDDEAEKLISTRSVIVSPCPHCGAWISPEREHLFGWQEAGSVIEAYEQARFCCPECGQLIDDDQRKQSMQDCRLVHHGQEITPGGDVIGPPPPVLRLWFRWSDWHNCLIQAGTVAAAEWEALQIEEGTQDRENAERDLCQKKWATPYQSRLSELEPIQPSAVRRRVDRWKKNILPNDTTQFAIGVDLGDWTGWWFGLAGRATGQLHSPAYGAFDVKRTRDDDLETRLKAALSEFFDACEEGFPMEGSDVMRLPDQVWIDIGYLPDWVADVVRERGRFYQNRFRCCRGRGASIRRRSGFSGSAYVHPRRVSTSKPVIGTNWYLEPNYERKVPEITFNADFWKLYLASRIRTKPGKPGALTLYATDLKNEHSRLSHHLCNEQFQKKWVHGRGLVEEWTVTGDQHWNDAATMACAALDAAGWRIIDCPEITEEATAPLAADNFYAQLLRGGGA